MDFAALPPEINSARMYAGPGAGPLMEASLAWQGIATQLSLTASSIAVEISGLQATWSGPSSLEMATAAMRHVTWLTETATQAEITASQAMAAAAAYEAAFAATVPPPIIAANRALLAGLIATNFLGINTPAIMATEAHYLEMWAQDIAAMFGYHAAAAQATAVPAFSLPKPIANLLGPFAPGSGNATKGISGFLNFLSGSSNSAVGNLLNANLLNSGANGGGSLLSAAGGTGLANPGSTIAPFAALGNNNGAQPSGGGGTYPVGPDAPQASLGKAQQIGKLSVPQSFGQAVGPRLLAAEVEPVGSPLQVSPSGMGPGILPAAASAGKQQGLQRRYGMPIKVVPTTVGS